MLLLISQVQVIRVVFLAFLHSRKLDLFDLFYSLGQRQDIQLIVNSHARLAVGETQNKSLVESGIDVLVGFSPEPGVAVH